MVAGYLLIPACALAHFGGIWDAGCPSEEELSDDAERLALERENESIQRRIDILEARLAAQRCEGEHPEIVIEPELPPAPVERDRTERVPDSDVDPGIEDLELDDDLPERLAEEDTEDARPPEEDLLPDDDDTGPDDLGDEDGDRDADEEPDAPRDLADLEGCWNLESELEFEMRGGDGGTQPFPEWNVCFDEGSDGNGTQVMRSDDGMLCEGPIQGAFADDGALVLSEDGDLVCNDGTEIFQRTTTCKVDEGGVAVCESVQPGTGGRGSFTLKRN